jgi:TonB-linked SusC/RagA family outer membrane protein
MPANVFTGIAFRQVFSSISARAIQLSLLFFLAISLHTNAQTLKNSISFSGENVPLCKIFPVIEEQCGYTVMYNQQLLSAAHPVNLKVHNMSLSDFLELAFKDQPLLFRIGDRTIFLSEKSHASPSPAAIPKDTSYSINGIIYEATTGKPLIGVTVMTVKNGKGAQTNEKGEFRISKISGPDVLSLSYIGYQPIKMKIAGTRASISLSMEPATDQLDQVVVQAYGVTSKRLSTGSITKVTGEEIARQAVLNPLLALQGKVPGMVITPNNGHSSGNIRVEIRGKNSVGFSAVTDPLYIVDGVPLNMVNTTAPIFGMTGGLIQGGYTNVRGQSPLFAINPKDIESIEVLKDADATAIYGSRAANGVVLITTKKARPGKTSFDVDYTEGWSTPSRRIPLMNTKEYIAMRKEAFANDHITPTPENAPDLMVWDTTRYTDWQKQMVGTGRQQVISLGINGGDERTSFRLNANYDKTIDLMNQSGANKRGLVAFNLSHRSPNDKLNISLNTSYSYTGVDAVNLSGNLSVFIPNAPPIFDEHGKLNFAAWNFGYNSYQFPFSYLLTPSVTKNNLLNASINISYKLAKGLTASIQGGVVQNTGTSNYVIPIAAQNPMFGDVTGEATFGRTLSQNISIEPQLEYVQMLGKARIACQVGTTIQQSTSTGTTAIGRGYEYDELLKSITNAPSQQTTELRTDYKYAGVFGRVNANWENKYLLNLNARRDGSSRFAPGKQYGNFGSIGAGWVLTEEQWLKDHLPKWLNFFKIRGSYGIMGSDGSMDYQYMKEWSVKDPDFNTVLMPNYNGIKPYLLLHSFNDQYQWESSKQLALGVETALFDNKLMMTVEYYRKRTDNQLTLFPTPIFTGFPFVLGNWMANVQNSGLEASLNWRVISHKELSLSINFNIGANRNKLISYDGIENSPYAQTYKVGRSLSTMYLLKYMGVDPRTGQYSYEDHNKDGRVTFDGSLQVPNIDDRYIELDLSPAFAGGSGVDVSYKHFNLNLGFSFRKQLGQNLLSNARPGKMENQYLPSDYVNNRWRKPGDIALYPPYSTNIDAMSESDRTYTDASFIRLNNLGAGYELPKSFVKKAGMQSCRVMMSIQNVFWISRYRGLDPEIQQFSAIPTARTLTGRLSFTF